MKSEGRFQALILEEFTRVGIVFFERFEPEQQGQVAQAEVLQQAFEVAPDEFFQRNFVMLVAFSDVAQKSAKGTFFDLLELRLHFANIGCQLQLQAVLKIDLVSGIDAAQIEVVFHAFAQGCIGLSEYFRHQEQGRAKVEAVTVSNDLVAAPARFLVLLDHGHIITLTCQASGSCKPADTGAND